MQRLVEIAQEQARRVLKEELGQDAAAAIDAAVEGAASVVAQAPGTGVVTDNFDAAIAAVQRKAGSGGLIEDDVVEWVRSGQIDEALAAIAHLAGVPIQIVARAYRSPHYDPLLFILRSVRFGWGTFKAFSHRQGRPRPAAGNHAERLRGLPAIVRPDGAARGAVHRRAGARGADRRGRRRGAVRGRPAIDRATRGSLRGCAQARRRTGTD